MKELTIEEKAKAYDELLIKLQDAKVDNEVCDERYCCVIDDIVPELKESEDDEDEKIRKDIISLVNKWWKEDGAVEQDFSSRVSMIAWLEKQGDKCLVNFDEAEKEKYDFVSGQFIECRKSFNEFKEDNSYWLEYIGDDTYIGRSDNILNQKFHITPRQLFTLFTWQHYPKEDSNVNDETNAPTGYGKYVDECLYEASKHFFSEGDDKYSVADLFYAGVRCGKSWFEKQGEKKPNPYSGTSFEYNGHTWGMCARDNGVEILLDGELKAFLSLEKSFIYPIHSQSELAPKSALEAIKEENIDNANKVEPKFKIGDRDLHSWLKSLRPQNRWKPTKRQLESLEMAAKYFMAGKISKNYAGKDLTEILQQLNKLREE